MRRVIAKGLFCVLSTCLVSMSNAEVVSSITFFSPRSHSANYPRECAGTNRRRMRTDDKPAQSYFNITPYYSEASKEKHIADALFGTHAVTVTGSMVKDRGEQDLLADYFGLSPAFESTVLFKPSIKNALLVLDGHWALDRWVDGLYLDVIMPVGWTQWYMGVDETVAVAGLETPFPARYMAEGEAKPAGDSFAKVLRGDATFGQMQQPLEFGKFSPCPRSTRGLSDVILALGWQCIQKDYGHFGINLRTAWPAGTRPKSEYFFEPVLGNCKHIELGMGFDGHVLVWEKDGIQDVAIYAGAHLTHLFNARQRRSFDLKCNNPLSRYMLVKEFDEQEQYSKILAPLINHTTMSCKVRVDIQVDMVVLFEYAYRGYVLDIGYNGFIRSREKIRLHRSGIPSRMLGIKGIQDVALITGEASSITQSNATIFGNAFDQKAAVADAHSPVLVSTQDIDLTSAAFPRFITHKLFTHFGHSWDRVTYNGRTIQPYMGFGGEIEFEGVNPRNRTQPVHDTLTVWGIWLKGGFAL